MFVRMLGCRTCSTRGILRVLFFPWRNQTVGSTRRIVLKLGTISSKMKNSHGCSKTSQSCIPAQAQEGSSRALRRQRERNPKKGRSKGGNILGGRRRKGLRKKQRRWRYRRSCGKWCRSATGRPLLTGPLKLVIMASVFVWQEIERRSPRKDSRASDSLLQTT